MKKSSTRSMKKSSAKNVNQYKMNAKSKEISFGGYKTQYFHMSPTSWLIASKMIRALKAPQSNKVNRVTPSGILNFLKMEDKFLVLELFAVCGAKNKNVVHRAAYQKTMMVLGKKYDSAMRKNAYVVKALKAIGATLKHHKTHLKQINSNHRIVNPKAHSSPRCKAIQKMLTSGMKKVNSNTKRVIASMKRKNSMKKSSARTLRK